MKVCYACWTESDSFLVYIIIRVSSLQDGVKMAVHEVVISEFLGKKNNIKDATISG